MGAASAVYAETPSPSVLHTFVVWAAAAFGGNPSDDLVGILNVAGLAVNAIGRIQADPFAVGRGVIVKHFIYVGRAEILARAPEFLYAACIANVSVLNEQVSRLVIFVLRPRMIEVGEFVESEFAVAFGWTDQVGLCTSIGVQIGEMLQVFVAGVGRHAIAEASVEEFLENGVEHPSDHAVLESLMEIAHRKELVLDPAGFDVPLELAQSRGRCVVREQCVERGFGG
jgi:hypothetical protein